METLILCAVYVPLSTTLISIISFEDMQFQFVFRHFIYQLLEDENEELTQLIFGPHSPVMRKAIIFLTITIIIISLIGAAFELRKWIRDRAKIVEGKMVSSYTGIVKHDDGGVCGILVRVYIIQKNNSPETIDICIWGKKCQFFRKFCVRNKRRIPHVEESLS